MSTNGDVKAILGDTDSPAATSVHNHDNNPATDGTRPKRIAPLTAKGKEHQLTTLKSFIKSMHKRLLKNIELIHVSLQGDNEELVNNECTNLEKTFTELSDAYSRIGALFEEDNVPEQYEAITVEMDAAESAYFACKEATCNWLLDRERRSTTSSKSKRSSKSGRSSKVSSSSQLSNLSLKQKAKVAGLKAEVESVKRRREAELNAELLHIEQKIKKAEAMERVYAEAVAKGSNEVMEGVHDKVHPEQGIFLETKGVQEKSKSESKRFSHKPSKAVDDLQIAMAQMLKLQAAPKPDLDVFTGNPLDYQYFKATFKEVVEQIVTDQSGRLTTLIKYTQGDAKDLIKHFVHADPTDCYDKAIALLDKEYGNQHLLSCSYIKELRQWKNIKESDVAGFKKIYRFLLKCQAYKCNNRLQELDSTDMIQTVISKLHVSHQG